MDTISHLLSLTEAYGAAVGVPRTTVSWRLFGDSKKLAALADGGDIQVRRAEKALSWLEENWPDGVARPVELESARHHRQTMAPGTSAGADNPQANISRTGEAA